MEENTLKIYLDEVSQMKQAIAGRVVLKAIEPLEIFRLTVSFLGFGTIQAAPKKCTSKVKASDEGPDSTNQSPRRSCETYIRNQKYLIADPLVKISSDDITTSELQEISITRIKIGIHKYSFEFYFPADLPSSFDGGNCYVEYSLEAVLCMPQHVVSDRGYNTVTLIEISAAVPVPIRGNLDLNQVQGINEESEGTKTKKTSFVLWRCCSQKSVEVTLSLRRRGFVCGEHVPFVFYVVNRSGRQVIQTEAKLIQYIVTFPLERNSDLFSKRQVVILSMDKSLEEIEKSADVWMATIDIPKDAPISQLGGSKIIDVQYGLQIEVTLSGCSKLQVSAEVPIMVGTVPLRKPNLRLSTLESSVGSVSLAPSVDRFVIGDTVVEKHHHHHHHHFC